MTQIFDQHTTNGHLTAYLDTEAGERAARDFARSMSTSTDTKASSGGSTGGLSTFDKIGAVASMVGALTGVASLGGSSGMSSDRESIEIELINLSSYAVVPYGAKYGEGSECYVGSAARPLAANDRAPLIITSYHEGFETATNEVTLSFLIGLEKSIKIEACLKFLKKDKYWFWVFENFTVDMVNTTSLLPPVTPDIPGIKDEIQAVSFLGKDGYPSFSLYSHMIHCVTGGTYLAFCDYTEP